MVSVDLSQGRRWGLAASGPLGCHGNHCAPMLAAAINRERAQGKCLHDRMVWAAFLPQVRGLALVRSTRAKPPVPILDLGGLCVMVGSGAQFRSGLVTTYVWLPKKVKCG